MTNIEVHCSCMRALQQQRKLEAKSTAATSLVQLLSVISGSLASIANRAALIPLSLHSFCFALQAISLNGSCRLIVLSMSLK